MNLFKRFFPLTLLFLLFFMTSCSKPDSDADIFQLKDRGSLNATVTATIDGEAVIIGQETSIPLDSLENIQVSITTNQPELAFKIYFDQNDSQFPVNTSPAKKSNDSLVIIQETYEPKDFPDFFTLGTHHINLFEIDPQGEVNPVPNPLNIKAVKTLSYEIIH